LYLHVNEGRAFRGFRRGINQPEILTDQFRPSRGHAQHAVSRKPGTEEIPEWNDPVMISRRMIAALLGIQKDF